MIRVEVEEYCHQCLDFSPDVIKPERIYAGGEEVTALRADTVIQCNHRKRCAGITRYLEQHMKGKASG